MIFVKGYGQMCNNILQYAHAYAWGRENGINVVSMRFSYKYRYFTICKRKYHKWPVYLFAKMMIKLKFINCLWLQEPEYDEAEAVRELKRSKLIAIDGWSFRFPDLFFKYRKEIEELFTIHPEITNKVGQWLEKHPVADIRLGLHVRRGDYATWMGGRFLFEDEVYIEKLAQFRSCFPDKKVNIYICTNDRHLDIGKYRRLLKTDAVYLSGGNGIEDLSLLSQCDYLIGVSSTFSLMASFYRNLPVYWIKDPQEPLKLNDFKYFEDLFMTV